MHASAIAELAQFLDPGHREAFLESEAPTRAQVCAMAAAFRRGGCLDAAAARFAWSVALEHRRPGPIPRSSWASSPAHPVEKGLQDAPGSHDMPRDVGSAGAPAGAV